MYNSGKIQKAKRKEVGGGGGLPKNCTVNSREALFPTLNSTLQCLFTLIFTALSHLCYEKCIWFPCMLHILLISNWVRIFPDRYYLSQIRYHLEFSSPIRHKFNFDLHVAWYKYNKSYSRWEAVMIFKDQTAKRIKLLK